MMMANSLANQAELCWFTKRGSDAVSNERRRSGNEVSTVRGSGWVQIMPTGKCRFAIGV
ncbi:MAG: hypothetical protein QOJ58_4554 [Alphaproteobacteria bacterium]|nr:hypothetical protein [Alphaproteobacteria bacterium]